MRHFTGRQKTQTDIHTCMCVLYICIYVCMYMCMFQSHYPSTEMYAPTTSYLHRNVQTYKYAHIHFNIYQYQRTLELLSAKAELCRRSPCARHRPRNHCNEPSQAKPPTSSGGDCNLKTIKFMLTLHQHLQLRFRFLLLQLLAITLMLVFLLLSLCYVIAVVLARAFVMIKEIDLADDIGDVVLFTYHTHAYIHMYDTLRYMHTYTYTLTMQWGSGVVRVKVV